MPLNPAKLDALGSENHHYLLNLTKLKLVYKDCHRDNQYVVLIHSWYLYSGLIY